MSDCIVKVKKNSNGEITDYVLSNGKTVSKMEGVKMAEEGLLDGVIISHSKKGEAYLKSIPDGKEKNNLEELN